MLAYSYSQKPSRIENDEYVFWQPGVRLTLDDYQGNDHPENLNAEELWKAMATENISFKMVVDHPKDSAMRGQRMEQLYMVPVFSKRTSYNLDKDTAIIKYDQLYFDMAELTTRRLRISLRRRLNNNPNEYGIYVKGFLSLKNFLLKFYKENNLGAETSVFFKYKGDSYEKVRKNIDSTLEITKEYATSPDECKRIMSGKPLIEDYREVPFDILQGQTRGWVQH